MLGWQTISALYLLLASLACGLAVALGGLLPLVHPSPWLALDEPVRSGSSLVLGLAFAVVTIAATRIAVVRWAWVRRLHLELRPIAKGLGSPTLVTVAVLSSIGEELFFRGFLLPLLGVVAQAAVFGLAHQMRGKSRWAWVGWATLVGLCLGAIFALTGSLLGPLVAHALINGYNLAFLRDHDPCRSRRNLGGLLAQSDA
jgi:membrane protease YdiL (CAAX protease family)